MGVPQTVSVPATVMANVAMTIVHVNVVKEQVQALINVILVFMKVDTKDNYKKIVEFEQHHSAKQIYILTILMDVESNKHGIWLRIMGLIETWDILR